MSDKSQEKNLKSFPDQHLESVADAVGPDFKIIEEKQNPTAWEKITSHRASYGSLIVTIKQVFARFLQPFTNIILRRQVVFNVHLVQVLRKMVIQLTRQQIVFQEKIRNLDSEAALTKSKIVGLRQENILNKQRLDRMLSQMRDKFDLSQEAAEKFVSEQKSLWDHDYFLFEDQFRGSHKDIQERQKIYLPIFKNGGPVLDIGCGRGEFLSLLQKEGIKASGIDLNEDMVHLCKERGLIVENNDAFPYLKSIDNNSLGGIFSSHVIEHLPTNNLRDFLELCYRKLKTASPLVFETPNPLSVTVSSSSFYLDLSHNKPIHPEAIKFLLESCGFRKTEIKFLSPVEECIKLKSLPIPETSDPLDTTRKNFLLLNKNLEQLNQLLYGFQDYAVIARKV